ncbi:MAG: hypothetical protein RR413_11370 [Christensenellaceae bacterium]
MKFFSETRKLFQNIDATIFEQLDTAEASFTITYTVLPTIETLRSVLELAPGRDMVAITLVNDSDDIVTFTNHQTDVFDYSALTNGLFPEDNIDVRIQIDKTVLDGKFSVYDYDSFVTDLLARPLPEIMNWFSMRLLGQGSLIFEAFDCDVSFSTRTMAFDSSQNALFTPMVCRHQRLSDCKNTACFYNMNSFEILPDDFIIQGIVRANNRLQTLFGKLATILSLAYVFSSSSISGGAINLQITGHRTVNYDIKLADIAEDQKWQNIYTWIFTDGNPTDKALITHNVISLHCMFEPLLNLKETVFEAIKTNYNLYLRNNVNQYLNMKRDIAKFIQNIVAQVGDYAIEILGKFKTNLLAIFGFLFTVVLTKIGSAQKWEDIFTVGTIYLIELFVIGSLLYLIICIFETRYKFQKAKQGYEDLKRNYADIFSEPEIKEAFQDDKLLNDAEKSVKRGMVGWTIAWGGLLLISIIIIEVFTYNHGLIVWLWNKVF